MRKRKLKYGAVDLGRLIPVEILMQRTNKILKDLNKTYDKINKKIKK